MLLPRISLVVPTLNQGKFIERTLTSIVEQHYPNLQLIVIDGGSSDNTLEVIEKFRDKIDVLISEKDRGQSDAINKGLRHCDGEIFNWLNSDDYYEPGVFYRITSLFQNKLVFAVSGLTRYVDASEKAIDVSTLFPVFRNESEALSSYKMTQPSFFWRLSVVKDLGGINESLKYVMDWELWIKYVSRFGLNHIVLDRQVYVNFTIHGESKTSSGFVNFLREQVRVYQTRLKAPNGTNIDWKKHFNDYLIGLFREELDKHLEDFCSLFVRYSDMSPVQKRTISGIFLRKRKFIRFLAFRF